MYFWRPSQNAISMGVPPMNLFPYLCRSCGCLCQARWNLARYENKQTKDPSGTLQIRFLSTESSGKPKAAAERLFWPSLRPRSPIYSFNLSDVDPVQLSELWLKTLTVRRDPKKIVKALRHSFAFVVVLVEDEDVSATGPIFKTVGVGLAVSDGSFIATICDVAVDPAYRHRGIGRQIVKKLVQRIRKIGGPSGFAVFPPPLVRRFFWMIGFRPDQKYRLMAYRGETETMKANGKQLWKSD